MKPDRSPSLSFGSSTVSSTTQSRGKMKQLKRKYSRTTQTTQLVSKRHPRVQVMVSSLTRVALVVATVLAVWQHVAAFQSHPVPRTQLADSPWSTILDIGHGSSLHLSTAEAEVSMAGAEGTPDNKVEVESAFDVSSLPHENAGGELGPDQSKKGFLYNFTSLFETSFTYRPSGETGFTSLVKERITSSQSDKPRFTSRLKERANRILPSRKKKDDEPVVYVKDVHELRRAVLQSRIPLKDVGFNLTKPALNATTATREDLSRHSVMQVIAERMRTNSTPGNRAPGDDSHLALAIEGGGMRGAVSAGMAAAIASLGLTDAIDSIYGSSAGCIVGAYMVSRQMCVDVYTEVLPAAGPKFASQGRVLRNIGVGVGVDAARGLRIGGGTTADAAALPAVVTAAGSTEQEISGDDSPTKKLIERASSLVAKVPLLNRAPVAFSRLRPYFSLSPGMNLTFVLDGIMDSDHGLRPFDMEAFRVNDAKQPLYAISSTVRGGKMETVAFGSKEGDYWDMYVEGYDEGTPQVGRVRLSARAAKRFFQALVRVMASVVSKSKKGVGRVTGNEIDSSMKGDSTGALEMDSASGGRRKGVLNKLRKTKSVLLMKKSRRGRQVLAAVRKQGSRTIREATACPGKSGRKGFYACLESSMLVPGAAGAPIKLLRSKHRKEANEYGVDKMTSSCFDAFCNEPIPYRSAVEKGATHVLALRSRPDGCLVPTKPATYEKIVAPVYFRLSFLPMVGDFFERQGSQYRYLEDVLTLDEGLVKGCEKSSSPDFDGVRVPPTEILLGTENDEELGVSPEKWKKAHLLPVILPANTPELPSLTQEKEEVLAAVRVGYAAAFEMLAPIAGLDFDLATVDSKRVAEMVFPRTDDSDLSIMENPVQVKGDVIDENELTTGKRRSFVRWMSRKRNQRRLYKSTLRRSRLRAAEVEEQIISPGNIGSKEDSLDWLEAEALLAALPGFQRGKFPHLAGGLRSVNNTATYVS